MNKVKIVPVGTREEAITFGVEAASAYHSSEKFLKDPEQKVDRQRFLDGIFKINEGIERLDTSDQVYREYMSGADRFDVQIKQARRYKKSTKKIATEPKVIVDPKVVTSEDEPKKNAERETKKSDN